MRLPYSVRVAGARLVGRLPVPVLSGPNAGRLWTLASAGRGYVTGRFESSRLASMMALLRPGDRFWDVGAHKGYVALAAARRVGPSGRVVAFEPAERNRRYLRRHVAWNRPGNLDVESVALSDVSGEAAFGGTGSSIAYRLGQGDETVRSRTIAELIEGGGRAPPSVLKVDVEGSEARVLAGAGAHLSRVELLFVAIHGPEAFDACRRILEAAGHRVAESSELRRCTRGGEPWGGDPDLLAWSPERRLSAAEVAALPDYR